MHEQSATPRPVSPRRSTHFDRRLDTVLDQLKSMSSALDGVLSRLQAIESRVDEALDRTVTITPPSDGGLPDSAFSFMDKPGVSQRNTRKGGKASSVPEGAGLTTPAQDEPMLYALNITCHRLAAKLQERAKLPQAHQADLVRASDAWQNYLRATGSSHSLSPATYNRLVISDIRWYRRKDGEYRWQFPFSHEDTARAFIAGITKVLRSLRVDVRDIVATGKAGASG